MNISSWTVFPNISGQPTFEDGKDGSTPDYWGNSWSNITKNSPLPPSPSGDDRGQDLYTYDAHYPVMYGDLTQTEFLLLSLDLDKAFCYFNLVIDAFGGIGNSFLFWIMISEKYRHFSFSVYLCSICLSDTLFLFMTTLTHMNILANVQQFWSASVLSCNIMPFLNGFSGILSMFLLLALSIDRFVAIVFPLKRAKYCTAKTAVVVLVVTIVGAVLCLIPTAFNYVGVGPDNDSICLSRISPNINYYAITGIFTGICSVVVVLGFALNAKIIFTLKGKAKKRAEMREGQNNAGAGVGSITRSLLSVNFFSMIVLLPLQFVQIIDAVAYGFIGLEDNTLYYYLNYSWYVSRMLNLTNYGSNFFILMLTGKEYRRDLRAKFRCLVNFGPGNAR